MCVCDCVGEQLYKWKFSEFNFYAEYNIIKG